MCSSPELTEHNISVLCVESSSLLLADVFLISTRVHNSQVWTLVFKP